MSMTQQQKEAYRRAYQERKREDERIRSLIPSPSSLPSAPMTNLVPAEMAMVAQPRSNLTPAEMPRNNAFERELALADQAEQNRMSARTRRLSSLDNVFGGEEQTLDLPFQKQETNDLITKPVKRATVDDLPTAEEVKQIEPDIDKWIDPNYKMSDEEKKLARQMVKDYDSWVRKAQWSGSDEDKQKLINIGDLTTPEGQEAQRMNLLRNKSSLLGNFMQGAVSMYENIANPIQDKLTEAIPMSEQDREAARELNERQSYARRTMNEGARTQSPIAYGAGKLANQAMLYAATSGATEAAAAAIGAKAGAGALGNFAINQGLQFGQDLALDTAPTYLEMKEQGFSDEEIRNELAKGMAINAGMNLGMGVLGEIPGLIRNAKNAKNIPQLSDADKMQEYFRSQANPTIERQLLDELNASDRRIAEEAAAQQTQIPTELVEQARAEQAMQRRIAEEAEAVRESRLTSDMIPKEELPKAGNELPKNELPAAEIGKELPVDARKLDLDDMKEIEKYAKNFEDQLPKQTTPEFNKAYEDYWNYIFDRGNNANIDGAAVEEALRRTAPQGADIDGFLKSVNEQMNTDGLKFSTDLEHTMKPLTEAEQKAIEGRTFRDLTEDEIEQIKEGFRYNKRYVRDMEKAAADSKNADLINAVEEVKAAHNAYYDAALNGDKNLIERYYKDFNNAVGRTSRKFDKAGIKGFGQSKKLAGQFAEAKSVIQGAQNTEGISDDMIREMIEADEKTRYARPANVKNDIPNIEPRERSIAMAANSGGGMGDGEVRKFSDMFKEDLPEAETDIPNVERSIPLEANDNVLRTKTSQGRTNTLERAGIDNEQELKEVIPESDFEYIPEQNKEQIAQASDMISSPQGRERAIERYTRDIDDKYAKDMGAVDIFAMAELRKDLNMAARAAVDPAEKAALYAQSRQIAVNLTKAGRASGRTLQAMSVLTRSADGAMMAAEGYARNAVEDALKGMPKVKTDIESVTQEIKGFLDNMDASAMTREQIENAIEKAISSRKHLKARVTKNDVKELTDAILNDRAWNDIQDHLEYLATGYKQISPETMDEVQSIFEEAYQLPYNSRQRMKLEQQAFNKLGAEIAPKGGSFGDKFDAWRYLAMLANPSTHIKNMVGNLAFGKGLVSIKNTIAAAIEASAEKVAKVAGKDFKRTKSILTPADNELVRLSRQDGIDNAFRELAGNKYIDVGSAIDEAVPAFNNKGLGKVVNKAADINSKALSVEDEIAGLGKYQTSLAGFLKANGADASIFNATDDASKELLEQARKYAISQAQEATFHQDSRVANALSQFTKNLRNNDNKAAKALGLTIDTIIPFKKTPINILRSTVQYSPVELFKVLTDIPKVKKGVMSGAEMIDDIAKTATGTGMLGIGALLAHNGIITSGFTDSDEKTNFDRTTGRQGIAVHINIPGMQPFTVSLSELSPASMPLIFGAAVYESKAKKDVDDSALDVIINGLSASVNAITDMTMLSGISDLLSNIRYAESDADVIKKIGSHVVGNLAGQMIPSVGGRIEKVIDENKRSTYATNSGTLGEVERIGRQAANKIPFLNPIADAMAGSDNEKIASLGDAIRNQVSVDAWGREMKQPGINALGRAALSLASPVSIQADRSDELDRALYDLEERSGLPAYPKTTQSEGNIDDKRLTGDQFTEYAKYKGQLSRELAEQLILTGDYDDTNDATKAGALNTMYNFAKAMAQDKAVGKEMSSTNQKLKNIYETEGAKGVVDYVVRGNETKEIAKQAGIKNNDVLKDAYGKGGATLAEQAANTIVTLQNAGLKQSAYYAYENAQNVIPGLDEQTFIRTIKAIDKPNKDGVIDGKTNTDDVVEYLNKMGYGQEEGQQIANAYYTGTGSGAFVYDGSTWKYKRKK